MPSSLEGLAAAFRRRSFDHEPALGPDRHDQRVLDHLRLHQAEHLGPEVLGPVRPAQAAAGHLAPAQMDGLDPRRVHEDLELGLWQREDRDLDESSLNDRYGWALPSASFWKAFVRTIARTTLQEAAEDAVLVEARDRVERLLDLLAEPLGGVVVARVGVEPRIEQPDQQPHDVGMAEQRAPDVGVGEADAPLAQVLGDRADDRHLASGQGRAEHQSVQAVVLEVAPPHAEERVVEQVADPLGVRGIRLQAEVVDPRRRRGRRA